MRKRTKNILLVVLLGMLMILYGTDVFARANYNEVSTYNLQKMAVADRESQTMINIGNWGFWVTYNGQTAADPFTGAGGGYYPRGTSNTLYMDGVIWGGYLQNSADSTIVAFPDSINLRVGGIGYRIGTVPGWVAADGTPVSSDDNGAVHIYRIRSDWATLTPSQVAQDAAELNNVALSDVTDAMENEVIAHYKLDWKEWPVAEGAPYVDVNGNGIYDPVRDDDGYPIIAKFDKNGNLVEGGDYPGIAQAEQVAWLAANDFNVSAVNKHSGAPPIGIELQITLWAYNQPNNGLGQIVFKKLKLINKSGTTIDSMFVAQYSDPDVGDYSDDLVGCDVEKSLHFAYNGKTTDAEFNKFKLPAPAVGFDFFQGPIIKTDNPEDVGIFDLKYRTGWKNLPMTSFGYFAAGGSISDPPMGVYDFTLQWYNMLNGYTPTNDLANPTPYTHGSGPLAGQATKFPLDGDPSLDPTGAVSDIDGRGDNMPAGDRRMFAASGPFTMAPGDTQEVVLAIIGGLGGNNIQSVADLKSTDEIAQAAYNTLFTVIPKPPTSPSVKAVPFADHITLDWGWDQDRIKDTEETVIIDYVFEGYNVYQLPSASAKLNDPRTKRVATYDLIDEVRTIKSNLFVPDYGTVVYTPIEFGTDTGVKRFFSFDRDYIKGEPLHKGTTYYLAVTSYNYSKSKLGNVVRDVALESTPIIYSVTLQDNKPGDRIAVNTGDVLTLEHTNGTANATVKAEVVNPNEITGDDYQVFFTLQHWYLDVDGVWKRTNYPDSVGTSLGKVGDVSPSTVTAAAITSPTVGTFDIVFTLDLQSPDYDWVDGVKLTFPPDLTINSWQAVTGAYGDYPQYGQNLVNPNGTYDATDNSITWGDSARSTFGGIEGTVYFTVNVNAFTPPTTIGYRVYDDGYGGNIVDAMGTITITEIGYSFKTEKYWNVKDKTTDKVVIPERLNMNDYAAPIADGLQFIVNGNYAAPTDFVDVLHISPDGSSTSINDFAGNAVGVGSYAIYGWGATAKAVDTYGDGTNELNQLIKDYECRWNGVYEDTLIFVGTDTIVFHKVKEGTGSMAYLIGSRIYDIANHPLNPNPGVSAGFMIRIPFEVWNIEDDMQVNILIYDRKQDVPDGTTGKSYDMWPFNPTDRMYTYFLNSPYSVEIPADSTIHNHLTWNLVWWDSDYHDGDVIRVIYANPLQIGVDTWDMSTAAYVSTHSEDLAKQDVEKVNVFPNPYYANNPLETDRFNRFVTFTHLPKKATIRIFNLAGVQVRKLEKDNDDQFLRWDLLNESNLPVASGLYVAHVDMPDLGKTKVLKVMIIQSKQILEYY